MLNFTFLSSSAFIEKSFGFRGNKGLRDFYVELVGWGKVEMLFYFDLTISLNTVSRSRLLAKLEPLLKEKSIFQHALIPTFCRSNSLLVCVTFKA